MRTILVWVAGVLLVAAATKAHFAGRNETVQNVANAIPPVVFSSGLDQSADAGSEVKLVLLALWPEGFDSTEMQLNPGEYLFIIGNRAGLKEMNLRLDREGNERLAAAVVGRRQTDFKTRLKLTTGTYVVTANDNPDWICRIVVGR